MNVWPRISSISKTTAPSKYARFDRGVMAVPDKSRILDLLARCPTEQLSLWGALAKMKSDVIGPCCEVSCRERGEAQVKLFSLVVSHPHESGIH
jgi:hypothetical protein